MSGSLLVGDDRTLRVVDRALALDTPECRARCGCGGGGGECDQCFLSREAQCRTGPSSDCCDCGIEYENRWTIQASFTLNKYLSTVEEHPPEPPYCCARASDGGPIVQLGLTFDGTTRVRCDHPFAVRTCVAPSKTTYRERRWDCRARVFTHNVSAVYDNCEGPPATFSFLKAAIYACSPSPRATAIAIVSAMGGGREWLRFCHGNGTDCFGSCITRTPQHVLQSSSWNYAATCGGGSVFFKGEDWWYAPGWTGLDCGLGEGVIALDTYAVLKVNAEWTSTKLRDCPTGNPCLGDAPPPVGALELV